MGDEQNKEGTPETMGTPENDILKSETVISSTESLSLSDVMKDGTSSEDATTLLTGEEATSLLTEDMSGPLAGGPKSADKDGFQSVGSGPLTGGFKPKTPQGQPQMQGMPNMPQGQPQMQGMPNMPQGQPQMQGMPQGQPRMQGMPQGQPQMQGMPNMPQGQPQMQGMPQRPVSQFPPQGQTGGMPQMQNPAMQPPIGPDGKPIIAPGMQPVNEQGRAVAPRPPKDPAKSEKTAKVFGLVTLFVALAAIIAVALLYVFLVILPKGEYKGAAEKGFETAGSVTPGGSVQPSSEQKTEEKTEE